MTELPSWTQECVLWPRDGVQAYLEDLCNRSGAKYAHIRAISRLGKFYRMAHSIGPYSAIGWPRRFRLLDSRDRAAIAFSLTDYRDSVDCRRLAEKFSGNSEYRAYLESLRFGCLIPLIYAGIDLGYLTLSWTDGSPDPAILKNLQSYMQSIEATVPLLYSACRSIITDNNFAEFWRVTGTILSSPSEDLCYENIALACLKLWGRDSTTYIGKIDPNTSGPAIVAVAGRYAAEANQARMQEKLIVPHKEGLFGFALDQDKAVVSGSLENDPRFKYHSLRENGQYLGSGIAMKLSGPDGHPIAVMSVEHPLENYFDSDDLRYLTGVAMLGYDALTVHKESDAAVTADINTLFTQILHDVTEPLQAIIADADVLRYESSIVPAEADPELASRLKMLSTRAANIVEVSVSLNKHVRKQVDAGIEGAATRVTMGRVNLFRLLNSLVDTWGDRAAVQGIEIRSHFRRLHGIEVQCDETELSSALGHLIGNAIKYSFYGRRPSPQSGGSKYGRYVSIIGKIMVGNVHLEIQNYGIGILASEIPKVKQPLFRGQLAKNEGRAGTGRGLSSADAFFTSMGGRVDVSSTYKGTPGTQDGPYSTTVTAVMPYITSGRTT